MSISIDGLTVREQRDDRSVTHRCATLRVAQMVAGGRRAHVTREPSVFDNHGHEPNLKIYQTWIAAEA